MRKLHNKSISKKHLFITLSVLLVICAILLFSRSKKKTEKLGRGTLFSKVVVSGVGEIQSRWELGDLEGHFKKDGFSCPELIAKSKLVGQEYFQCNRLYLECFLQAKAGNAKGVFYTKVDDKKYQIRPKKKEEEKFYTKLDTDGNVELDLEVREISNMVVTIKIQNTCKDLYLPKGIYSPSTSEDTKEIWDNEGLEIYVDKFYVTRNDVNEWIDARKLKRKKYQDPMFYPFPATDLSKNEKIKYCAFRKKQLLESRVLDAASFLYDEKTKDAASVYKSPYHWMKGKKESFLYKARYQALNSLDVSDCNRAYVQGCQQKSMDVHFPSDSVSWMGMKYPLGYYPEYVVNRYNPEENLMPSSFYFKPESEVHEIGYRAKWDESGYDFASITLKNEETNLRKNEYIDVAFRCMKVVSQ